MVSNNNDNNGRLNENNLNSVDNAPLFISLGLQIDAMNVADSVTYIGATDSAAKSSSGTASTRGNKKRLVSIPILMLPEVVFPCKNSKFSIPISEDNLRVAQFAMRVTRGFLGSCVTDDQQAYKECGTLLKVTEITDECIFFEPLAGFQVMRRGVKTYTEENSGKIGMINVGHVNLFPQEKISDARRWQDKMMNMIQNVSTIAARGANEDILTRDLIVHLPQSADLHAFTWMMGDRLLDDNEGRYLFLKLSLASRFDTLRLLLQSMDGDSSPSRLERDSKTQESEEPPIMARL